MQHSVDTYYANIYVGRQQGYEGNLYSVGYIRKLLKEYCDTHKLAVTLTETEFIYVDGDEPGVVVGLINYPRFPSKPEDIRCRALEIAKILQIRLKQERVSIVTPSETIMLGEM